MRLAVFCHKNLRPSEKLRGLAKRILVFRLVGKILNPASASCQKVLACHSPDSTDPKSGQTTYVRDSEVNVQLSLRVSAQWQNYRCFW